LHHALTPATQTMKKTDSAQSATAWQEIVREQIESLRFGTLQITVHEGRVTRIDRTEKIRISLSDQDRLKRTG